MSRRTLFISIGIVFIFICNEARAHEHLKKNADAIVAESPINIASEKVNKLFVAPPAAFSNRLKSAGAVDTKIEVTYEGFPQEAKRAFEYAVSIWENLVTSPVPIKVLAKWKNLEGSVLALSRPGTFHIDFDGAPLSNVYYPVALAEKLSGKEINNGEADIICSFNNAYSWYFGTDGNTPVSQYDFVSSVLHEITHGLGVSGFLKENGGNGFFNNNSNLPSIYDYYIFNSRNQQISDKSLFNSPSADLHHQLTSNELKFFRPKEEEGLTVDWLYAPTVWREGASIYHLKGTGYDHGLMTPFASKGEAIHNPGENTMQILSEMGWKSITFDFNELKDIEEPRDELPVQLALFSDLDVDSSTVKVVFSTDYFSTKKTAKLSFDKATKQFTGNIPLDFHQGNVLYYFELKSTDNRIFKMPASAPEKKFLVRIGPDYSSPELLHNPLKIISNSKEKLNISVLAKDNLGINSVKIEYKLNGILQEPLQLENAQNDYYKGIIPLQSHINEAYELEYRIIAKDNSLNGNSKIVPADGFYEVKVTPFSQPVSQFSSTFDNGLEDFICADFSVSQAPGFDGNILHTQSPYPLSALEDENYDLIAQLQHPIILEENGTMTFDEVVLVEPGGKETSYFDDLFWDYVIVEASKNNGNTWLPLTEGYDASDDALWYEEFTSSLKTNISQATGSEKLFLKQTINLTDNSAFQAGDTVIIRFRLASDKSVNGWGWAIDNLEIQKNTTSTEDDLLAKNEGNVFPNPFTNSFYVDCSDAADMANVNIEVTDLFGKTVFRNSNVNPRLAEKVKVDLSASNSGVYLVNIRNGNSIISTNKLVKN